MVPMYVKNRSRVKGRGKGGGSYDIRQVSLYIMNDYID